MSRETPGIARLSTQSLGYNEFTGLDLPRLDVAERPIYDGSGAWYAPPQNVLMVLGVEERDARAARECPKEPRMATPVALPSKHENLRTLPGDDARQVMWRFAERYDLQMLVQAARGVARGPVARLVADGARHEDDWTPRKATLLDAYDASGITGVMMSPEEGGFIEGSIKMAGQPDSSVAALPQVKAGKS